MTSRDELAALRYRLKLARNREKYWSGRPSFSPSRFVPGRRGRPSSGNSYLEHDKALEDICSIKAQIDALKKRLTT